MSARSGPPDTFEERARAALSVIAVIEVDWERGTRSAYVRDAHSIAQAKFATGSDEEARATVERSLAVPWESYYDPEFPMWAIMDCYMRWKDVPGKYTPELREQTKRYFAAKIGTPKRRGWDGLGTYNQRWMRAVAVYLAHQEWPEHCRSVFKDDDPNGAKVLDEFMSAIVHRSHGEILSHYNLFDFGPLLTLHTFTSDPALRRRAKMTLDWMMIHHACFFFRGHCGGPTHRTYVPMCGQADGMLPDVLYFGGPTSGALLRWKVSLVVNALADYRPPAVAAAIAWDRGQRFTTRGSYISHHKKDRHTSFFNRSYVLFSQYEIGNRMGINSNWHHEALRWAVRWDAPATQLSTFFLKHPCPKRGELLGDTWFHQVLQNDGTLIGVFNIPTGKPESFVTDRHWRPYALGVYPDGYAGVIDETADGRLFLHYGTVLIGLHCTRPFKPELVTEDTGKGTFTCRRFDFPSDDEGLKMGYVVETARAEEYPATTPEEQLAVFREALGPRFAAATLTAPGGQPTLEYTAASGMSMHLGWRGLGRDCVRRIDRKPIPDIRDNGQWPLLSNPWVRQDVDGQRLTVSHGGRTVVYDFAEWAVSSAETGAQTPASSQ